MKIGASSAISRIGASFGERRRRAEQGQNPALTDEDEANVLDFSNLVRSAMDLLEMENQALNAGDVHRVSSFYEEKARILRDLTLKEPVVEPFLKEDAPSIVSLREMIRDFANMLERNGELLDGMATASRTIISEVETIRKRQSLDGLYDKTGQRVKGLGKAPGRVISNL